MSNEDDCIKFHQNVFDRQKKLKKELIFMQPPKNVKKSTMYQIELLKDNAVAE